MLNLYKNFFRNYTLLKVTILLILLMLLFVVLRAVLNNQAQVLNINIQDQSEDDQNTSASTPAFVNNFEYTGKNSQGDKFILMGLKALESGNLVNIDLPNIQYFEVTGYEYNATSSHAVFDKTNSAVSFDETTIIKRNDNLTIETANLIFHLKTQDLHSGNILIDGDDFYIESDQMKYLDESKTLEFIGNVHLISEDK